MMMSPLAPLQLGDPLVRVHAPDDPGGVGPGRGLVLLEVVRHDHLLDRVIPAGDLHLVLGRVRHVAVPSRSAQCASKKSPIGSSITLLFGPLV
jgi:hypothetical protein